MRANTARAMRYYPTVPAWRAATMTADLFVVSLILAFAAFSVAVHGSLSDLADVARGVESAGRSASASLESAAERVDDVPVVGGALAAALRDTGGGTSEEAVALGRSSREDIESAADLLAGALFLIPTLLLLVGYLPNRWAQVQRLTAGARVLGGGAVAAEHRQLVAGRALFHLPYHALLRHTDDPFGDFRRGHYEPLVAAAHEAAGVVVERDQSGARAAAGGTAGAQTAGVPPPEPPVRPRGRRRGASER